ALSLIDTVSENLMVYFSAFTEMIEESKELLANLVKLTMLMLTILAGASRAGDAALNDLLDAASDALSSKMGELRENLETLSLVDDTINTSAWIAIIDTALNHLQEGSHQE